MCVKELNVMEMWGHYISPGLHFITFSLFSLINITISVDYMKDLMSLYHGFFIAINSDTDLLPTSINYFKINILFWYTHDVSDNTTPLLLSYFILRILNGFYNALINNTEMILG